MLLDLLQEYADYFELAGKEKRYRDTLKLTDELRLKLHQNPPPVSEVLELLSNPLVSQIGSVYQLTFMAVWSQLSTEYVPVLCRIVMAEEQQVAHEPAVELLIELGDESAIPALKKAITYRWDGDQGYFVPCKALQALRFIGTSECRKIIEEAANSPIEEIQEEAQMLLADLDEDSPET